MKSRCFMLALVFLGLGFIGLVRGAERDEQLVRVDAGNLEKELDKLEAEVRTLESNPCTTQLRFVDLRLFGTR